MDRATSLQPALSLWKASLTPEWQLQARVTQQARSTRSSTAHTWPFSPPPGRQQGLSVPQTQTLRHLFFSSTECHWGVSRTLEECGKDVKRF